MDRVLEWTEWFIATVDFQSMMEWEAAMSFHSDPVVLDKWATIIELNRLARNENKPLTCYEGDEDAGTVSTKHVGAEVR